MGASAGKIGYGLARLHHAKREGLEAQNRGNHPHFESWLDGMLAYVSMVNPGQARPLREQFQRLRRTRR